MESPNFKDITSQKELFKQFSSSDLMKIGKVAHFVLEEMKKNPNDQYEIIHSALAVSFLHGRDNL